MNHKSLFTVGSIVLFIFGLIWILIPDIGLGLYGISPIDVATGFVTRYWGSAFLGLAALLWLSRKATADSIAVRGIIIGSFVMAITGLIVAFADAFWGSSNNVIWSSVLLYGIFTIWCGLLMLKK
ncbi:MAG: hypothetical protein CVU41_09815 [Chloroflexi bacterium HGW-Chloroflexi-3]|nr:MAG: hypothetical protein CVU41_09815 [Chloroflexi bacterium HGW-Chloroflexi-3]